MIPTMNLDVFAATTSLGIIKFIFIISAYLLPYILIPFMIKSLSGVFGNLAGMVNDRSKGLLDRNAKFRQNKRAEKMAAAKGGARFNGRNAFTRGLNRAGAQGYTATGSRPFGTFGQRGKEAREQNAGVYAAQQGKENAKLQHFMNTNDDGGALLAMSGGNVNGLKDAKNDLRNLWMSQGMSAAEAEEKADAAESAAKAMGVNRSNSMAAWNMMAQNKARSLGAVTNAWETGGILANAADRQGAGNNVQAENARQGFQFHARGSGAHHLGGDSVASGMEKAGLYAIANGQTSAIQAWGEEFLANPTSTKAMIHYKELKAMEPNTTGANRDEVNRQINMLEAGGIKNALSAPSGRIDPATSRRATVTQTEKYDGANLDRGYQARFTPADRALGYKTKVVEETGSDMAERASRAYERPDPNHI
jgi:hypothetical protein